MAVMVVAHPIPGFSGRVAVEEFGLTFVGGFTGPLDVPAHIQTRLSGAGFTLNATPGMNYGGAYVLDADLSNRNSAIRQTLSEELGEDIADSGTPLGAAARGASVAAVQGAIEGGDLVVGLTAAEIAADPTVAAAFGSTQADYVSLLLGLSNYTTMSVKKISASRLQVVCATPQNAKLTYEITDNTRYQYVGQVTASGPVDPGYQVATTRAYPANITLTGTYLGTGSTSTAHYTTTVGNTWTTTITTTAPNAKVSVTTFADTRGGRWNLDLVEAPAVTGTFTTWNAAGANVVRADVMTIPTPGTYTLRATFAGNDGVNTPTSTARGWLIAPDNNSAATFVSVSETGLASTVVLSPESNKDFAFSIRPASGGTYQFVPYHGVDTEDFATATVYLADGKPIDIAAMAIGASVSCKSFEIVQHIYGLNDASGATNLIEVRTKQRFTPDGRYSVTGRWKTLVNIVASSSTYPLMLPVRLPLFDEIVSSIDKSHGLNPGAAPANLWLVDEKDRASSYAALSSTSDYVAAVRYTNRSETLREGRADKPAADRRTFIELRTGGTMAKIYPRLFADDSPVAAGTVHRFTGDFYFGEIPGARSLLSLAA